MNISATRKVSGSSSSRSVGHSNNKVSSAYYAPAEEEYVENIDVSNKVSVKEDSHEHEKEQQQNSSSKGAVHEDIYSGRSLLRGSVEELNSSDITEEKTTASTRNQRVGVYGTNQNLYDKEENAELDKFYNENYVKHLYENNSLPDEVDELV